MNENAKKWVSSLRSGDYEQSWRHLRTESGYCCLGVACDLYSKETGKGKWTKPDSDISFYFEYGYKESSTLPFDVVDWLGLSCTSGKYHVQSSLTQDNDGGKSFAEIADVIESEPEGLFRGLEEKTK